MAKLIGMSMYIVGCFIISDITEGFWIPFLGMVLIGFGGSLIG